MRNGSEVPAELASLVRGSHGRLVGLLTLHTGSRDEAEDLAQDTIERACAHWEQLRDHPAPERWLFRVALNLATSRWRRVTRTRALQDRLGLDRDLDGADLASALDLRREVAALPARERDAVICRYYLDLSVTHTAEVLGCPDNTVKTLTRRGLSMLRLSDGIREEATDEH